MTGLSHVLDFSGKSVLVTGAGAGVGAAVKATWRCTMHATAPTP